MMRSRGLTALIPAILFGAISIILWRGLFSDPKFIPSVLINKPVPEFSLSAVEGMQLPGLSHVDLKQGNVTIVNIFASWCVPCREEQPLLMSLSTNKNLHLVGINDKDAPADARNFLETFGNPFSAIGSDIDGRTTINFGSYGVPETFIVDGAGVIRYKVIGGLGPSMADGSFFKEVQKAALPLKP
jgi:cytochrome c biogenesis protein CcmG, thiol:disulfide interchange protein DsbE